MKIHIAIRSPAHVPVLLTILLMLAGVVFAAAPTTAVEGASPSSRVTKDAGVIRIHASASQPHTDENGNTWLPAQGFSDGDTKERPWLKIENTTISSIYCSERFGMSKFSHKLPNGKYVVNLHFAVTYEEIRGPGQVVFSVVVAGHEIKDLDVWKKAGGRLRAYVESVPVNITKGELEITFIGQQEEPSISAVEIVSVR
jgi:hypothetical protein